jgi:hypothetical protein
MESETDKKFSKLFNELVPSSGNCNTLEGEVIRAVNKIDYRFWNDGDYPTVGYGVETSGPALVFLKLNIQEEFSDIIQKIEECYQEDEKMKIYIDVLKEDVVEWVESKNGKYTPNEDDMYNYQREAFDYWGEDSEW